MVNAFWSLTMYDLPKLLVKNPIDRYVINSPMLPNPARPRRRPHDTCRATPGKDRQANWLPAPKGPFMAAMRYYLPAAVARGPVDIAADAADALSSRQRGPALCRSLLALAADSDQPACTSMRRGCACACFGMRNVSTPSFRLASMRALSSSRLRVNVRR